MSDRVYVGKNVKDLDISEPSAVITKVILIYTSESGETSSIEVGDNTGSTLEVNVPWGSEEMAQAILSRVGNYQYRAYTAKQANINPATELGDGVTIGDIFSGIFHQVTDFQFIDAPDIESPHEEESDNEYKFESPQNREFTRQLSALGSRITQTAEYIQSEVLERTTADQKISSSITQTAKDLVLIFRNELSGINSYIRIENGTLILGLEGNEIELREYNNKVAFVDKGTGDELAYISNNRFYMPNATVTETMDFGGYRADATNNGIVWKWIGRG